VLRTPAVDVGILASITRQVIIDALPAEENAFPLADLVAADEAFLASTGRDVQPVARIGDARLPSAPGPRTTQAQHALREAMLRSRGESFFDPAVNASVSTAEQ
jgi:branched-chain amino acid aminotransferase